MVTLYLWARSLLNHKESSNGNDDLGGRFNVNDGFQSCLSAGLFKKSGSKS